MVKTENAVPVSKCGNLDPNGTISTTNGTSGPVPMSSHDCTSFLELDPEHLAVRASMGELDVKVRFGDKGNAECDAVVFALHSLLERTPLGWNWLLDIAVLPAYDIYLMDGLLAIGRELRTRGGSLAVKGVRMAAFPTPFAELFLRRCREERIEIIAWNEG